ncbi:MULTISPECIES: hypothetical protein [Sphingobium]|uniref:hypothetical protein n=1 Tax=Sphingobium TaxID=165695 RepID=UPI00159C7220|nr:hypothetical protein [Sphingobium sp. 15-1]
MHWLEPLAEVDGMGFGPIAPEDVATILNGSSAKAIGRIAEHPFIKRQQRLTFSRAGRTRPLSLDDYRATGGWASLTRARSMSPDSVISEVLDSGLRGRGGSRSHPETISIGRNRYSGSRQPVR